MPRRVRLVVCSGSGRVLGALPPVSVTSPWWPDVEPVVRVTRERFGMDVTVLRLLAATNGSDVMGGHVTYLAELDASEDPNPRTLEVARPNEAEAAREEHALRAPWARAGGVAATVAWADEELEAQGRRRTGPAVQIKSWNLSSVLRLPTSTGNVWSKSVPPFMSHEGAILQMVAGHDPSLVPRVLAYRRATGTALLEDVPGKDRFEASEEELLHMIRTLVRLQARWAERVEQLLFAGLPDWRAQSLAELVRALLQRPTVRENVGARELAALDALAADLARRFAALHACGLPETLVHGDFHPGNWRSDGDGLVLLDWGDSGVGHPMLDLSACLPRIPDKARPSVLEAWLGAWLSERPLSDPAAASELIEPIAALRQAVIYQRFLDGIEPSERPYHEADVPLWLRRAASAFRRPAPRM